MTSTTLGDAHWRDHGRTTMNRKSALRAQLAAIAEELSRLEARPDEPAEGSVIRFNMQFGGRGTVYEYAAIRAGDGKWYTTGPRSPKGYTWDALLDWMLDGTDCYQLLRPSKGSVLTEIEQ